MRFAVSIAVALLLVPVATSAATPAARTYDLRGPAPRQGTIVQRRVTFKTPDGASTSEEKGTVVRSRVANETVEVTESEIVQTDARKVNLLRQRIVEKWGAETFGREGEPSRTTLADNPLAGETLLIERQSDGWSSTLLGREPTAAQRALLRDPYFEPREIYPDRRVAVGESWVVDGAKLAMLLGFGNTLSAEGKGTFTLDRVSEEAGDLLAVISSHLELRIKLLAGTTPLDYSLGANGTIRRSLRRSIDVSSRVSGSYLISGTVEGSQTKRTDGGPIEVVVAERIVTPATRAAIVHRGSATAQEESATAPDKPSSSSASADAPSRPATVAQASCKGTAVPCAQRDPLSCSAGSGCSAGGWCGGVPSDSCFGKAQFACATAPGCYWQNGTHTCGGMRSCAGKDSFSCGATAGCTWQTSCSGQAQACSALRSDVCALQPGCYLG